MSVAEIILPTAAQPRALSASGGPYEAPAHIRDKVVLLDTHELLIAHGHALDQHILAYADELRRRGVQYVEQLSTLTDIRAIYENTPQIATAQEIGIPPRADSDMQHRVRGIMAGAVKEGASDIHIYDEDEVTHIAIRVHGLLEPYASLPSIHRAEGRALRSAMYNAMCDVADPNYRPSEPQDGRLKAEVVEKYGLVGARLATRPMDRGELMVVRLLYRRGDADWSLERLGYLPEQQRIISDWVRHKDGLHIFSGATSSGKSTSLEVLMGMLIRNFHGQINVVTLEDPPEYRIAGAKQTPVFHDDWAGGIRNMMRLDPDVIMVGEMRDQVSVGAAFQAALTGHGVWTTLHANDPFSILQRLDDLGLHRGLYTDYTTLRGLIFQSLVPTLCAHCRIPLVLAQNVSREERMRWERYVQGEIHLRNIEGCAHCRKGLNGRTVVSEVVETNEALIESYLQRKTKARQLWIKEQGGISKTQHVLRLIASRKVDPQMAEQMVTRLDADDLLFGARA